jgi:hypothetical protein
LKFSFLLLLRAFIAVGALISSRCHATVATCHVVGPTGKPVSGATVYVFDINRPDTVKTLTTNALGTFSVDIPFINPSYISMRECIVDTSGLAAEGCILNLSGDVTIQLTLPTHVTGTVVDESGKPVAGAAVTVIFAKSNSTPGPESASSYSYFGIGPLKARFTATTSSDGTYTISDIPAGSIVGIALSDPAYVAASVTTLDTRQPAPPLVARPATFITGQVVRRDGKPVGAVNVQAMTPDADSGGFAACAAKSDSDGYYKITSLPPATYSVGVGEPFEGEYSPDWVPSSPVTVTTTLNKPGVAPNIVLSAGGVVTGVVIDAKTKTPVSDVYIDISDGSHDVTQLFRRVTVITDQNGRYSAQVCDGGAQVTVGAVPGAYVSDLANRSIVVARGQTTTLDPIDIMPGLVATGKVVRADGKPTGHVTLFVSRIGSAEEQTTVEQETAGDGSYTVHGLSLGTYSVSVATSEDGMLSVDWVPPTPVTVTTSDEGPTKVPDINLVPGTTVTGTVVDAETKKPIPYIQLDIQDLYYRGIQPRQADAITNQDGHFSAQVWAGTLQLNVNGVPDGYINTSSTTSRTFKVTDGKPITLDPITLVHGLTAAGAAVDDAGTTVPGLRLQIQKIMDKDNDWINVQPVTTGEDGSFLVQQLVPGSYDLDAGADWTVVSPSTFDVPSSGSIKVVVKKTTGTTLQGTVVDTSGAPVAGASLVFERDHFMSDGSITGGTVSASTDSDGFFTILNVPVKSNMIQRQTVTKDGYVYQSGGDITSQDNRLKISLVVMARLGGIVKG